MIISTSLFFLQKFGGGTERFNPAITQLASLTNTLSSLGVFQKSLINISLSILRKFQGFGGALSRAQWMKTKYT